MARVSVWRRVGTRLSAALVAVAVPFAMVGLSPLFVSTASTVPTAAAVVATTPAREAVLLDRLDDPAPSAGRPQVVAEQTTISGGLVLTTKADRNRKIAVKSRKGGHVWTASSLAEHDLPSAAMRAYKHAAASIDTSIPGCHLPWTLLAGIGRVESDHGRYGGSVLGNDGVPRPAIVGVALNGKGPVAAIRDSDDGAFDGDKVWDRAVGPMQFIPTTWQGAGRDGDGDGKKSPNDIDDASLAAAAYLCHAGRNLSDQSAVRSAVLSYNPSDYYVALVTAFARGYSTGVFVIPSPEVQPGAGDGVVPVAGDHAAKVKAAKAAKAAKAEGGQGQGEGSQDVGAGGEGSTAPGPGPGARTGGQPCPCCPRDRGPGGAPAGGGSCEGREGGRSGRRRWQFDTFALTVPERRPAEGAPGERGTGVGRRWLAGRRRSTVCRRPRVDRDQGLRQGPRDHLAAGRAHRAGRHRFARDAELHRPALPDHRLQRRLRLLRPGLRRTGCPR